MANQRPTLLPERLLWPADTFRSAALKSLVRVKWFIRLRWLAVVGAFVLLSLEVWSQRNAPSYAVIEDRSLKTLSLEVWWQRNAPRPTGALVVVGALALVNLVWQAWSKTLRVDQVVDRVDEGRLLRRVTLFANAQIAMDLLLLTLVLRFYGGVGNPMAMFYVFHMVIASMLLTPGNALLQGVWAMLLYGGLLLGSYLDVLAPPAPMFRGEFFVGLHGNGEFVLKTYAVVCIAILVTWHLASQVAAVLDARERQLRARDQALEESRQWIDELHARRVRFMRTAAHQLKSPLTGIQTLATLIADGEVTGLATAGVIHKIVRRCREAVAQVNELLTLARIRDAPSERHRAARTPLTATIRRVVDKYRELAAGKGQKLEWRGRDGQPAAGGDEFWVNVDARDLEDCIGNLVDNAVKYTPDGGQITVSHQEDGDWVAVRVRDNGPGIEAALQEAVFDEFRRGNQALAARTPGSGLGLSIVREIVEQADGYVSVRSPVPDGPGPGPGAEFVLRLPRCKEPAPDGA